jgi:hypothetical protein
MTSPSRQQYLLLALLAVAVAAAVLQWRGTLAPATGAAGPRTTSRSASPPGGRAGNSIAELRLERLQAHREDTGEPARNPFRFRVPEAAPPEPVEAAPRVMAPVVPSGPPPPPPIPLKFIGLLDAPERIGRVAILSDSRGAVFYGKEGDIIDGRYQVLRIGADSADLSYTDGRGRQTLRLSGQ